ASGEGSAGRRVRVPEAGRENGEWGQSRPGLSCSTTRLPPAWCLWLTAPLIAGTGSPATPYSTRPGGRAPGVARAGTSLVRALALHGVARHYVREVLPSLRTPSACAATWPHPLGRGEVS